MKVVLLVLFGCKSIINCSYPVLGCDDDVNVGDLIDGGGRQGRARRGCSRTVDTLRKLMPKVSTSARILTYTKARECRMLIGWD